VRSHGDDQAYRCDLISAHYRKGMAGVKNPPQSRIAIALDDTHVIMYTLCANGPAPLFSM
jgi:hypothetical protein